MGKLHGIFSLSRGGHSLGAFWLKYTMMMTVLVTAMMMTTMTMTFSDRTDVEQRVIKKK